MNISALKIVAVIRQLKTSVKFSTQKNCVNQETNWLARIGLLPSFTAQKEKKEFSIKSFFSKCDQVISMSKCEQDTARNAVIAG